MTDLEFAWTRANECEFVTIDSIESLVSSREAYDRLLGMLLARRYVESHGEDRRILDLGASRVEDQDSNCRWQALIIVGEFIGSNPSRVWEIVKKYGCSADPDIRAGVATVLLEHLLEADSSTYEPLSYALGRSNSHFAETLRMCWTFGEPSDRE